MKTFILGFKLFFTNFLLLASVLSSDFIFSQNVDLSIIKKLNSYSKSIDSLSNKNFQQAIQYSDEALKFAKKNKNKKYEADYLRLKGNVFYLNGSLDSAGIYYYRSLKILDKEKFPEIKAVLFNNLGRLYRKLNQTKRALYFYDNAFSIYNDLQDEEGLATIYNESGVVYEYMGNYEEAIKRYQKSLKIQEKRSDLVGKGYALEFIGGAYLLQKNFAVAEEFLQKSLEIRKKTNDKFAIALNYNVLGNLFFEKGDLKKAEVNYLESNRLAKELDYLDLQKSNFEQLSKIYKKNGSYDLAYANLENFRKINDSIFSLGKLKQIEELSTKYETVKKDKEILQNKNKIFKRNVAIFSLLGLFLTGGGIAFSLFRHRKKNEKIQLQKTILHQQDLATKAVMYAEDNERKRMATHLHDGIGQLLSAANMNVEVLGEFRQNKDEHSKILDKTKNILKEAITDVRSLSHQIMPNMLIKNSLSNALRELIEKSNSPKLNISLKIEGLNDAIDQNIQVVLYRTIQECINNTIKHAEAKAIEISVIQDQQKIVTQISDNGKGFNPLKVSSKNEGLGLENIKSRIDVLKGNLEINSEVGKGTSVWVEIPI